MKKLTIALAMAALFTACDDNGPAGDGKPDQTKADIVQKCPAATPASALNGEKVTQKFADTDNIESVRVLPGTNGSAIAVASKAKAVYRATLGGSKIATDMLLSLPGAGADDELTNAAAINGTDFAVTRTIIRRETAAADAKIVGCAGELIIYDGKNCRTHRIGVGPMPDAVAVSPDKKYIITADELDSTDAWGKCPVDSADKQGVSIIDISGGYDAAKVVRQIKFTKNDLGPREPEYVAIGEDSDTVAVTLQDSHEIAVFSLKTILATDGDVLDESAVTIRRLPANDAGANPWPDGIAAFRAAGRQYFAVAGEWNDTIIIVDKDGNAVSNTRVTETEVPTSLPCVDDNESPRYSPDSVASFVKGDKVFVAATLRFAGAVIVYDVTNPEAPAFSAIRPVGENDVTGCSKDGSKVYPEGISAGEGYFWTANEGESSVTVVKY